MQVDAVHVNVNQERQGAAVAHDQKRARVVEVSQRREARAKGEK